MRARIARSSLVLALAGCAREELLHGLDEPQANEVLVALDEGGIRARKARERRRRRRVDGGGGARATPPARTGVLAERELPRPRPAGLRRGLRRRAHGAHPDRGARALPARARRRAVPERRGDRRRRRGARPPRPAAAGSAPPRRAPRAAGRGAGEVPARRLRRGPRARGRHPIPRRRRRGRARAGGGVGGRGGGRRQPAASASRPAPALDPPRRPRGARRGRGARRSGWRGLRARLRREAAA